MAHRYPVSVKGVAVRDGRVLLLENERAEWELPGGKLDLGEDPAACVAREFGEETGWQVTAARILDCWQYHIGPDQDVLIVTYGCHLDGGGAALPVISGEHRRFGLFAREDVPWLRLPDGYRRSIMTWFDLIAAGQAG